MRSIRLVAALSTLVLASGAAHAKTGKLTSVEYAGTKDAMHFTLTANKAVARGDVSLRLDDRGRVIVLRVNGVRSKRYWVKAKDRQLKRTLALTSKKKPVGALVRIRLAGGKKYSPAQLNAARIKASGRVLTVALPRSKAIAKAWAAPPPKKKKVVVLVAPPPPPPPPPAAPPVAKPKPQPKQVAKKPKAKKKKAKKKPKAKKKKRKAAAKKKPKKAVAKKEPKKAAPAKKKKAEDKTGDFVEGELAEVGTIGLIPWENRFGLVLGIQRLGEIFYGAVTPEFNYTPKVAGRPLSLSFGAPLRVEILDSRADRRYENAGSFRTEDWDEVSDFAKVIQRITYGGKEQRFYLDINRFKASSIGHGTILKRYNPNLNFNTTRVSAHLDAFFDYAGFETTINDITGPNIVGGLVFIKPLSLVDRKSYLMRSFSIGFTAVADIDAPLRNKVDSSDVDNDGRREVELEVDQDTFQPQYLSSEVFAYGIDVELKLVDTEVVDWKVYTDYSFLESGVPRRTSNVTDEGSVATAAVQSGGFTLGNLFRINAGTDPVHALRLRFEYRNYDPNYLPSYFDTFYEIQRVQYFTTSESATSGDLANTTKLQRILGRDPDAERVNGAYFEASYALSHFVSLSLGIDTNDRTPDNNMYMHLGVPHLGRWQLGVTYSRGTADDFADLWDFGLTDNDLLIAQTRYGVADWLHLNLEALTVYGIGARSVFESQLQVNFSAEFGFSY